jgi:hypothetical protein
VQAVDAEKVTGEEGLPKALGQPEATASPDSGKDSKAGIPRSATDVQKPFSRLFSWLERRRPTGKRPVASRSNKLVQAELTLESVQVVRNDLSDSDLEVVPARSGTRQRSPDDVKINPGVEGSAAPAKGVQTSLSATRQGSQSAGGLRVAATTLMGRLFGAGKP